MWFIPQYILILALTIIVDYVAGIYIEESTGKKRKTFLVISILTTCLILFFFKYFNFFNANFKFIADSFGLNYPVHALNIILPIGLSFHTFQSLSYVIEVYRGNQKAERNFGIFSLYVMFYPQLVAGPIERPQNLLYQFRQKYDFEYKRVTSGLKLMAWGLFKKVVIADRLADVVTSVYSNPYTAHNGIGFTIATVFFAFQIYCDFSGYSDIAIGSAEVMGFKLMENFNKPYFSKTISEFWKRWHISLSTWFKDYLYISMGGNRCSKPRWQFNLFFTFLVSGFWHGASWTYVAWGAINGFYLVFALWTQSLRDKLFEKKFMRFFPAFFKAYQILITFILVCIAWIFFRATHINDAIYIIKNLHTGWSELIFHSYKKLKGAPLDGSSIQLGLSTESSMLVNCFLLILFLIIIDILRGRNNVSQMLDGWHKYPRWIFYYILVYGIIFYSWQSKHEFIYFQF